MVSLQQKQRTAVVQTVQERRKVFCSLLMRQGGGAGRMYKQGVSYVSEPRCRMKRHAEVETRGGPTPRHPRRHILSPANIVGQGEALEWRDLEVPLSIHPHCLRVEAKSSVSGSFAYNRRGERRGYAARQIHQKCKSQKVVLAIDS
jgi:hypothetical protein